MFFIEHSGSAEHNKISKNLKEVIEEEFGETSEFIIGDSRSPIILYDENMNIIYQTDGNFNKEIIKFYIESSQED